ncbi:reverse transcriptase domain-containing protein [Tanacetum coccineum]
MKVQAEEAIPEPWTLFTDGSSCLEGSGAGLILTIPEDEEFPYALSFEFNAFNNEAEYEALVAGLRIAEQVGVKNLIAKVNSRLIANQINGLYEAKEQSITHIRRRRVLLDDTIGRIPCGRKSFLEPWLRCVGPTLTEYVVKEIHEGLCSMHSGPRSVVAKAIRFKLPGEIISENRKQFRDNPFKDWCEKLNIKQSFAFVKHPQTNDQVERANRSLGEGIKSRLGEVQQELAVIPVEIGMPSIRCAVVNQAENDEGLLLNLDILEERREKAAVCEARNKAKMEKNYNAKSPQHKLPPRRFFLT